MPSRASSPSPSSPSRRTWPKSRSTTGTGVGTLSLAHDDSFLHDNGPSFVTDGTGGVAGVDWRWNAWGNRYPDHERDGAVAESLLEHLSMRRYAAPLVLEGGAIDDRRRGHADRHRAGAARSQPQPQSRPGRGRAILGDYLGAQQDHLDRGRARGRSGGRADRQCRLLREAGTVLALSHADSTDVNHAALQDNIARLKAATDAKGRTLEVVEIEQPRSRQAEGGRRLPLSYTSLYLANGAAIVPAFEDPQDSKAFEIYGKLFPGRNRPGAGPRDRLRRRRASGHRAGPARRADRGALEPL